MCVLWAVSMTLELVRVCRDWQPLTVLRIGWNLICFSYLWFLYCLLHLVLLKLSECVSHDNGVLKHYFTILMFILLLVLLYHLVLQCWFWVQHCVIYLSSWDIQFLLLYTYSFHIPEFIEYVLHTSGVYVSSLISFWSDFFFN